jgi:hypothetical protein
MLMLIYAAKVFQFPEIQTTTDAFDIYIMVKDRYKKKENKKAKD